MASARTRLGTVWHLAIRVKHGLLKLLEPSLPRTWLTHVLFVRVIGVVSRDEVIELVVGGGTIPKVCILLCAVAKRGLAHQGWVSLVEYYRYLAFALDLAAVGDKKSI